jgi:hypothetical protein
LLEKEIDAKLPHVWTTLREMFNEDKEGDGSSFGHPLNALDLSREGDNTTPSWAAELMA